MGSLVCENDRLLREELVLGRIYADIRAFRIYDGATEVHKMAIAKRATRRARAALEEGRAAVSEPRHRAAAAR